MSSSLRQLHDRLHCDGVTCYYDSLLEAEAIGGIIEWGAAGNSPSLRWPEHMLTDDEADTSDRVAEPATSGRVQIVVDVIRRLKAAA
jgi:uroporphyrinogen-III decarboxylase